MLRAHSMHGSIRLNIPTALMAVTLVTSSIHAQSTPAGSSSTTSSTSVSAAQHRAVVHYERSRAYYAAGRYRAAAAELETAIRLDPRGYNLYFDLGLVYERIGQIDRAIEAYRHYLHATPDPAERERTERILARLQGARNEIADIQRRWGHADTLFWSVAIGSVASAVTGSVLLAAAIRTDDRVNELRRTGATDSTIRQERDRANTLHLSADVALIGSAGLAVTAALLFFTREAPPRNTPVCVTAFVSPQGATLGASTVF